MAKDDLPSPEEIRRANEQAARMRAKENARVQEETRRIEAARALADKQAKAARKQGER